MGFISKLHHSQKKQEKQEQGDFERRQKEFAKGYSELVNKWQVDYAAVLGFVGGGSGGIVPQIKVIDIKKAQGEK